MGVEEGVENWRALGLVIVKGSQVHLQLNRFRASVWRTDTRSSITPTLKPNRKNDQRPFAASFSCINEE